PQLSAVSNNKLVAIESTNKELLNYRVIESITLGRSGNMKVYEFTDNEKIMIIDVCGSLMQTISDLCKEFSILSREETLMMFEDLIDEKIFNISNRHLWVQELSKQQWATYLREQLKYTYTIDVLFSKTPIEDFLQKIIDEHSDKSDDDFIVKKINQSYHGSLVKWEDLKNQLASDAYPRKESEYKKKQFFAKKSYIQKLLDEIKQHKEFSLPPPNFDAITRHQEDLCMDGRYPFKELINDYIEDKITMTLYGSKLLNSILNNNHQIVEKLYNKLFANINLLNVAASSFNILISKYPQYLENFLSQTSFILSSTDKKIAIRDYPLESHLQKNELSKEIQKQLLIATIILGVLQFTLDTNTNIFRLDELYKIVSRIQNDKWEDTIKPPFLSNTLLNLIDAEKDQNLKNNYEKEIQELKTFFSEEIEKLKSMIDELKNSK
ncbi:15393_t:CDS:2, partial [Racocetra fulgida]